MPLKKVLPCFDWPMITTPSNRNDDRIKYQERNERVLHHGGIPGRGRVRFISSKVRVIHARFIAGDRFTDGRLDWGAARGA
jgi:hypothetical protein